MVNVKIVDFYKNTGSTHKKLGIDEIIDDALANNIDTITVISSGNYIGAIRQGIERRGLTHNIRAVNLVNKSTGTPLEVEIKDNVILRDGEEREKYIASKMPEALRVRDYTDFVSRALQEQARRIVELDSDLLCLGVGSGKLYMSLYQAIKEQGSKTKLVGLLPVKENGVFNDDNLYEQDGILRFKDFSPKSKADKLVTPYTLFKERLLATQAEGHRLIEIDNKQLKKAQKIASIQHVDCEISGSAGFITYDKKFRERHSIPDGVSMTIISTGKGVKPIYIEPTEYQKISSLVRKISTTRVAPFMIAGLLAIVGTTLTIHNCNEQSQERETLLIVAGIYHNELRDKVHLDMMSNNELDNYITASKPVYKRKVGGPIYFQ